MRKVTRPKKMKKETQTSDTSSPTLEELLKEGRELRDFVRAKYSDVRSVSEQKLSLRVD